MVVGGRCGLVGRDSPPKNTTRQSPVMGSNHGPGRHTVKCQARYLGGNGYGLRREERG